MAGSLAAAAIGGGLSFLGSSRAASATESAAGRAADAQIEATRLGIEAQREMFDISRGDIAPWRQYGLGALELMGQGFGLERAPAPEPAATAPAPQPARREGPTAALQQAGQRDAYIDAIARTRHGRIGHSAIEYGAVRDQVATQFDGVPDQVLAEIAGANTAYLPGVYESALQRDLAQADAPVFSMPSIEQAIDGDFEVVDTGEGGEFTEPIVFDPGEFTEEDLRSDPSYQFRLDEGLKAIERGAAAGGYLGSGRAGKSLARFASDMASTEYGNAYNRWYGRAYDRYRSRVADVTDRFNRLAALSGVGQASATQQSGLAGQAGQTISSLHGQSGAGLANIAMNSGNTLASLYANQGNALANTVTSGYQNYVAQQNQNRFMGMLENYMGRGQPITGTLSRGGGGTPTLWNPMG